MTVVSLAKSSGCDDVTAMMLFALVLAAAAPPATSVARASATILSGIALREARATGRDLPRVLATRERRCDPPAPDARPCRLIVTDLP